MPTPKQEYAAALRDIARRFADLDKETVARSLAFLRELRDRLQLQLTTAETFNAFRLEEMTAGVDRLIADYDAKMRGLMNGSVRSGARLGALSVVEPIQAAGFTAGFFQASPAQINVLLDFTADLITGISQDVRKMITTEIRLAALGERSTISAMQAVNAKLGIPAGRASASGVAYRGERIVRTEVSRVFNLATHSQQLETARAVPGLKKQWLATGDGRTRLTHLIAHNQYSKNPIPIDQPFIVGGAELMYPLDPAGPAGETINCRCTPATVHPEIGPISGPLDKRVDRELDARKEAA